MDKNLSQGSIDLYSLMTIRLFFLSFLCDACAEEVPGAAVDAGDALRDGLLVERVDELVVHLVVEAGRALRIRSGARIQNML